MVTCARKYQHNSAKYLIKGFCKFSRIFISPLGADISACPFSTLEQASGAHPLLHKYNHPAVES